MPKPAVEKNVDKLLLLRQKISVIILMIKYGSSHHPTVTIVRWMFVKPMNHVRDQTDA
jgi:hypothetical protein